MLFGKLEEIVLTFFSVKPHYFCWKREPTVLIHCKYTCKIPPEEMAAELPSLLVLIYTYFATKTI